MMAVRALAGAEPVSAVAARHGVSRPLVYRQMRKASAALDEAFSPTQIDEDADKVLFSLPVTRRWLEQVILALTMIGHASMRVVIEFMSDLLGVSISLGTVHNVHQRAAQRAMAINNSIDLSAIRVGLHDEIFQGTRPVLTGIDAASTYCYLLADEDHRDGDTWAIHLLDLQRQGLHPDFTIADAGTGLRAGQKLAWPDTPCHGDVFHICQQFETLANIWTRLASGVRTERKALEARLANPRRRCQDSLLIDRLDELRPLEARAHQRADDLRTLALWLERDVLSLAGPDLPTRQELFDFIVEQLRQREPEDPSRIGTMRVALQNQRNDLLAFAGVLDQKLDAIASDTAVAGHLVRATCLLHRKPETSVAFWQAWNRLHAAIGRRFHEVWTAVSQALHDTPRSSSLVENLNSRLRNCLTLRHHLDGGRAWLELLKFFVNHRRFTRSRCSGRVGKSPREAMTGEAHSHWLTLLGLGPLQPRQI
ncbi:hypothetical protein KAF44_22925 (plasmid) [Cupriavidus necator]|nr:hypothetical protein KAF44_22925 [Cupriavidus necator]